jgi:hypothetical protein
MKKQADLFGFAQPQTPLNHPPRWCLSTNHLNMMYMLSAGLVMSPKGFGKKYYTDSLKIFPGWIPLFADVIPKQIIHNSTIEDAHLKPCVVTINLASLKGRVKIFSRDGITREIAFPGEIDRNVACLLVPAPLPTCWIDAIVFKSKEDKQSCTKDAQNFPNVPLIDFNSEVDPRLLAGSTAETLPSGDPNLSNLDESPDIAIAAGGMMAMLFQFANLGECAVKACRLAFDGEENVAASITDPLIKALYDWRKTGNVPSEVEIQPKLFWGSVNKVAGSRSAVDTLNPLDMVLKFLDDAKISLDGKQQVALIKLSDELRAISGFADSTITEIFERHSKLFSRAMTLFFLRQESEDLIEFRHPLLTENDYIVAAMLFAARDGWISLPSKVREQPGMNAAVSHRMAAMAHRLSGTGIDLGNSPPRCFPLRELFAPGAKGWSAKQKEAALDLAQESKWDCIHTKVSLGKGDYRMIIDGSGTHILIPGVVKAVVSEVDIKKFFLRLEIARVTKKLDKKIRKMLPL